MVLVFMGFVLLSNLFAQTNSDIIEWSEKKLVWEDFQATPPKVKSDHRALNFGGVKYSIEPISIVSKIVRLKVQNVFYKKKSWTISNDDYVLNHEQLHSDIREVCARQIRKKIIETKFYSSKTIGSEIETIYSKLNNEMTVLQDKYDDETGYTENTKKLQEWNEKIAKQLEELKEYSNPEIIITLEK